MSDQTAPGESNAAEHADSSGRALVILSVLGALAGIAIGLVGGSFRWLLDRANELRDDVLEWSHTLGPMGWFIPVLGVALGTTLAMLFVRWVPQASGSGIQIVEAVNRGQMAAPRLRVLPAKFFGGLLAMGSGLVLGREGPTVHMGATLGAEAGRLARRPDADVRSLQTSLAGAGLAVAFNAPVGAALFVFEEVAKSFRLRLLLPTMLSVAAGVGVSWIIIGDSPDFRVNAVETPSLTLIPLFVIFGLLTGFLGALYSRLVVGSLDLVARFARIPAMVKAAIIGALIGALLFVDPNLAGGGDSLAQLVVGGQSFALPLLMLYFVVRFVAGPVSYAAGTPGGLFAPLLAVGAVWGLIFTPLVQPLVPGDESLGVAFAIVGMGAFFAAVVRAPFTGIVIVMEMTATTSVTVPMIAAAGCAVLAATLVKSAPIYDTLRLRMLKSQAGASPGGSTATE